MASKNWGRQKMKVEMKVLDEPIVQPKDLEEEKKKKKKKIKSKSNKS